WATIVRAHAAVAGRNRARRYWGSCSTDRRASCSCSPPIETWPFGLAVKRERAPLTRRIRPYEDPILPSGETSENFGFHRLGTGEAQRCLHAGERIGGEREAFLHCDAQCIREIELVRAHRDKACGLGRLRVERLARGRHRKSSYRES